MRRIFLLLAVVSFLVQVAAWPCLGIPSAQVWPAASLAVSIFSGAFLLETRGPTGTWAAASLGLAFGVAFPALATNLGRTYGFGPAAWLPGVPLAWAAFLLLSLALADQARWYTATCRSRSSGPWVGGFALALLEVLWDPVLLAEGALWSRVPSHAGWPWGFSPGFPILHFLLGWGFSRLMDRMGATGRPGAPQIATAAAALVGAGLTPVLLGAWSLGPAPPSPGAAPVLAEVSLAVFACLASAWGLDASLPHLLPRRSGRVLLTTCPGPIRSYPGGHYPLDFYSSRSSRGQGPWTSEVECPYLGAHLIANNLRAEVVVLEYPDESQLEEELREVPYEVVGIGFTVVSREGVRRVCDLIRRIRPDATIVLGGYGVVCLPPTQPGDEAFDGLVDEVCEGEGIGFMRRLLGEPEGAPVDLALPPQRMFPMGLRLAPQSMMVLVAGFGCDKRCGFCGTSAFFGGKNVRLASDAELASTIERAFAADQDLAVVAIFDEDFLADRGRLSGLVSSLRERGRVNMDRLQFSAFGTLASLAQYSPEELAELGVGFVWVGVESKFTNLKKIGERDAGSLLAALEEQGIGATVSWILGLDQQTPENLPEDLAWLTSLPSVTAQVSL
ncbi:MAG: cobalamin B12-binding domain-containing protein, partial [Alphaproteobacteria bacterium]|nr:cobalamin B12-binding domain-containing protein [Alphaproteobacteria bacterium]